MPLYRSSDATTENANLLPGLLDLLGKQYHCAVSPENFIAYLYGVLAQPAFTSHFSWELETRELRVPLTKAPTLFKKACTLGEKLLWLHTYGERFVPQGKQRGAVPAGQTKCLKAVPGDAENYPESFSYNDTTRTLTVGEGQFAPVAPEVYEFEVSGLKVVHSWLKYRMKGGAGKGGSPLNEIRPERWPAQFTTELLELLWVLEATVETYPDQARLLDEIIQSGLFQADELPSVPDKMRKPPHTKDHENGELDFGEL